MSERFPSVLTKLVDAYVDKLDWKVQENSNQSYSVQGLNNYICQEVCKEYWLNKLYPLEVREAHECGDIHIHDLGMIATYCVGWDLQDVLAHGFGGVRGLVESAAPVHFDSALGQLCNFMYTLQGESAGAQAVSNFDTLLAPFIRYDKLEYRDVRQAMQVFVYNLNIPTRVGFQTPFTNITFDLVPPSYLVSTNVMIGGKLMQEKYGDFKTEMAWIVRAFLEIMSEGDSRGRVFTFPIPTFNITKDFSWDEPHLKHLWTAAARFGIPYFANYVNSDMNPDDARSMCCRLRLDTRQLHSRGGGLFGANPLTGSIGVVTINMARIGFLSSKTADAPLVDTRVVFFARLDAAMQTAKQSLLIKRRVIERFTEAGMYPFSKHYLRNIKARFGSHWHNHFCTIGLIGVNEAALNFIGQDIGTEAGIRFAEEILVHMRRKLAEFQAETDCFWNLEATPAEGASYRLASLDKLRCPSLVGFRGRALQDEPIPTYTNSTQLPVDYDADIISVCDKQDKLQSLYTGGTVLHVFLGEAVADPESAKAFVRKLCTTYRMPYFTLTPTFSVCATHGYLNGDQPVCPHCHEETEVYSRVVGYIRPVKQWNVGKKSEYELRATHKIEP